MSTSLKSVRGPTPTYAGPRPRQGARQGGDGERAEEGDHTAEYPAKNDGTGIVQLSSYSGGHPENAAANGDADKDGNGIEQTNLARQPLAPTVGLSRGHRVT